MFRDYPRLAQRLRTLHEVRDDTETVFPVSEKEKKDLAQPAHPLLAGRLRQVVSKHDLYQASSKVSMPTFSEFRFCLLYPAPLVYSGAIAVFYIYLCTVTRGKVS